MDKHIVGQINGYDVFYLPEKQKIFCKNTLLDCSIISFILNKGPSRREIPEKNLVITKNDNIITLGCLTTSLSNCLKISSNINKYNGKR